MVFAAYLFPYYLSVWQYTLTRARFCGGKITNRHIRVTIVRNIMRVIAMRHNDKRSIIKKAQRIDDHKCGNNGDKYQENKATFFRFCHGFDVIDSESRCVYLAQ